MASSSILGGTHLPEAVSGKDTASLGPSDNSDTGSDALGAYGDDILASDSDSVGTGERAAIEGGRTVADSDILPDHVESLVGDDDDGALDDDSVNIDDLASDDEAADDGDSDDGSDDSDGDPGSVQRAQGPR